MTRFEFFLITSLIVCIPLLVQNQGSRDEFIVWNVGQGLWTTLVKDETCHHFDMGGEHAPWRTIESLCGRRANRLHFSHWDWDHISFAEKFASRIRTVCVHAPPAGEGSAWKKRKLARIPLCGTRSQTAREISFPARKLKSNDASRIFVLNERLLLPGDSTARTEKIWARALPSSIAWLILGHHGSQTSTSPTLLAQLPRLRVAIASARREKYGHPHKSVMERVSAARVALLKTEDWGHLRMEWKDGGSAKPPAP